MMTEKKAQHERRQKMHEDDLQQIQEYEEYFAQLAIEEAERAEQERIAAEARAEEERAQKVIHDAAAKIQALYRGFRERQELANPKGKGKKGKGSGAGSGSPAGRSSRCRPTALSRRRRWVAVAPVLGGAEEWSGTLSVGQSPQPPRTSTQDCT